MVDDLNLNGNSHGTELAAPERREGERSEPARSGGAASLTGSAVAAPADPEVVAKAKRRRFTAAYKLAVVEEAERATAPGAIGALSKKRGRKPTRDPLAEENQRLRKENARLTRQLQQAETIIDVQKKISTLLGIPLPETPSGEENS